jgi:hypothetical protein
MVDDDDDDDDDDVLVSKEILNLDIVKVVPAGLC